MSSANEPGGVSSHADTIRRLRQHSHDPSNGYTYLTAEAASALDALLAENKRLLAQNVRDDLRLRETFAKNQRLRDALEQIATEWEGNIGTGQMLTDFCREALAGDAE